MPDDVSRLIEHVEAQERELVFSGFTAGQAWTLGSILVELATTRALPVTIDVRRGPQQAFHAALEGTSAHNDAWIIRKSATVQEFGVSSLLAGLRAREGGHVFEEAPWIDASHFSGHGGAFPITVDRVGVVGVVTVSGLPQREDHELAVEGVRALLARESAVADR